MAKLFAGLDVGDTSTSICVIGLKGKPIFEQSVPTEPAAITQALKPFRRLIDKVGHESGCKATWLHKELLRKKLPVICLDARYTHAALAANPNKTDKNDARGIAQVLSRGIYTTAYVRSDEAHRTQAILNHRKALIEKAIALELLVTSTLKLIGAKLSGGKVTGGRRRKVDLTLVDVVQGTLKAAKALKEQAAKLDKIVVKYAKEDAVCRRLMTMPGVGPITALTFRAAIDDPSRFRSPRAVSMYFGLTPRTFQSGQSSFTGHISKRGDSAVRSALYQAAASLLTRSKSQCHLRSWGLRLRKQKGFRSAAIACARRMARTLHWMWIAERDFPSAYAGDARRVNQAHPFTRTQGAEESSGS